MSAPTQSSTIPTLSGTLIDDGSILLLECLGAGSFGQVYKAISTESSYDDPIFYDVKVMVRHAAGSWRLRSQTVEIAIHKAVADHPNIIGIHKTCSDDSFVYVVMDLCNGGTLTSFMNKAKPTILVGNDELVKKTFIQIIDAVHHCHTTGFAHRDLKPDNILVDKDEHVFLADFGVSTSQKTSRQFGVGTGRFVSPEGFGPSDHADRTNATPYSTVANDVWSLGIILIMMIAGQYTWGTAERDDLAFQQYLHSPEWLDSCLTEISDDALNILKRMLDLDQEARIGLEELKQEVMNIPTFFHPGRGEPVRRERPREEIVEESLDFGPCFERVKFELEIKPKRVSRIHRRISMLFRNKAI